MRVAHPYPLRAVLHTVNPVAIGQGRTPARSGQARELACGAWADAVGDRVTCEFGDIVQVELAHDVAAVDLYRGRGDVQPFGNTCRGVALGDELQHLTLACRQRMRAGAQVGIEAQGAGDRAGDLCWRLPLDDDYAEALKTNFADVANVGGRPGGSITAAQAADELLSLKGVKASFVVFPSGENVQMSARSLGEVNVQVILEALGGGGNSTTAGGRVENTDVETVKSRLLEAIDAYFEK